MIRLAVSFVTLAVLLAAGTAPGRADTVIEGETGDGAFYRIVVPDIWNGDLAIWNHGLDLEPRAPLEPEDLGPLAGLQLAEGYAVAASSYRQIGWAVFKTKNDLQNLLDIFKFEVGMPDEVLVTGASLGGLVTVAAIEAAHLGNVTGALSLCGAVAGSPNWDGALDLRLTYDAVCKGVPGAFVPGGAEGLPEGSLLTEEQLAFAVNACTGILAPPELRTPGQSERLQQILDTARIPESFLLTNMGYVTFVMSDLVHDPRKLAGHIGTGNAGVYYEDPLVDATIERVAPHPGAQNRLARRYTPTGDVGATKIVSLHTDKDGLVVVENESAYAAVVPAGNLTTAIVVEAAPTHCGFTAAETAAAWESLRFWVAGGPQPTADSLQVTCQVLESPDFPGPCRIDPAFDVPPLDTRIRPRE
jgi:hypothetical protein